MSDKLSSHTSQLTNASSARQKDVDWTSEYNLYKRESDKLEKLRTDRNDYLQSVEHEKIKYNREYNYSGFYVAINAFALVGCTYMWFG